MSKKDQFYSEYRNDDSKKVEILKEPMFQKESDYLSRILCQRDQNLLVEYMDEESIRINRIQGNIDELIISIVMFSILKLFIFNQLNQKSNNIIFSQLEKLSQRSLKYWEYQDRVHNLINGFEEIGTFSSIKKLYYLLFPKKSRNIQGALNQVAQDLSLIILFIQKDNIFEYLPDIEVIQIATQQIKQKQQKLQGNDEIQIIPFLVIQEMKEDVEYKIYFSGFQHVYLEANQELKINYFQNNQQMIFNTHDALEGEIIRCWKYLIQVKDDTTIKKILKNTEVQIKDTWQIFDNNDEKSKYLTKIILATKQYLFEFYCQKKEFKYWKDYGLSQEDIQLHLFGGTNIINDYYYAKTIQNRGGKFRNNVHAYIDYTKGYFIKYYISQQIKQKSPKRMIKKKEQEESTGCCDFLKKQQKEEEVEEEEQKEGEYSEKVSFDHNLLPPQIFEQSKERRFHSFQSNNEYDKEEEIQSRNNSFIYFYEQTQNEAFKNYWKYILKIEFQPRQIRQQSVNLESQIYSDDSGVRQHQRMVISQHDLDKEINIQQFKENQTYNSNLNPYENSNIDGYQSISKPYEEQTLTMDFNQFMQKPKMSYVVEIPNIQNQKNKIQSIEDNNLQDQVKNSNISQISLENEEKLDQRQNNQYEKQINYTDLKEDSIDKIELECNFVVDNTINSYLQNEERRQDFNELIENKKEVEEPEKEVVIGTNINQIEVQQYQFEFEAQEQIRKINLPLYCECYRFANGWNEQNQPICQNCFIREFMDHL